MTNLELSVALATAPASAFRELRERPRFWFPLLLAALTTAALTYWYYAIVDIEWLKDAMFGNDPDFQKGSEEERAAAASMLTRKTMLVGSLLGTLVVLPVVLALQALYLLVAGKVTKLSPGFKHWFALSCWTSLTILLSNVVAGILLLLSDTSQISPGVLQPLSLDELLLHRPMGSPGQSLIASLSIPAFLSWALMIIGVREWSQRSWLFSTVVVLLPWVVIYGIWAFTAFR
jgi:hypothetical protein